MDSVTAIVIANDDTPPATTTASDRAVLVDNESVDSGVARDAVAHNVATISGQPKRLGCTRLLVCMLVAACIAIAAMVVVLINQSDQSYASTSWQYWPSRQAQYNGEDQQPYHERTTTTTEAPEPRCRSDACDYVASDLFDFAQPYSYDANARRCSDFYDSVCGGTVDSSDGGNMFDVGDQNVVELLDHALLGKENTGSLASIRSIQTMSKFYQMCTASTGNQAAVGTAAKLADDLREIYGGWPIIDQSWNSSEFSLERVAGLIAAHEDLATVVKASVTVDWRNVSRYALHLDQAILGMNDAYFANQGLFKKEIKAYKDLLRATAKSILREGSDVSVNQYEQRALIDLEVETIFSLEADLAKAKTPESTRKSNWYLHYERASVSQLMDLSELLQDKRTHMFNWTAFLEAYLPKEMLSNDYLNRNENTMILLGAPFFEKLATLYQAGVYSKQTWQNYLLWRVVLARSALLQLDPPGMEDDSDSDEDVNSSSPSSGFAGLQPVVTSYRASGAVPGNYCMDLAKAYFPWALGRLHANATTTLDELKQLKIDVELFTDSIIASFAGSISSLDNFDGRFKLDAENKLRGLSKQIAYPDWIFDDKTLDAFYADLSLSSNLPAHNDSDREPSADFYSMLSRVKSWSVRKSQARLMKRKTVDPAVNQPRLTDVGAAYTPELNSISIPATLLQGLRFGGFSRVGTFSLETPGAYNYGILGWIIAREIAHAFDSEGIRFDASGELRRFYDENGSFRKRDKCLGDLYAQSCYPLGEPYSYLPTCVDGSKTLQENLADKMAINVTWLALKAHENFHGKEPRLSTYNMDRFSSEQLFFLSYARMWCEATPSADTLKSILLTGSHSPSKLRVNKVLQNFRPFGDAWNCKSGSSMTPLNRCDIW